MLAAPPGVNAALSRSALHYGCGTKPYFLQFALLVHVPVMVFTAVPPMVAGFIVATVPVAFCVPMVAELPFAAVWFVVDFIVL